MWIIINKKEMVILGKIMTQTLITQFFAYMQMREKEIFHLGELQAAWGISSKQEKNLLSRLVKRKTIIRLKREIYLVPRKIPPGGMWQPDSLYLVSLLMEVLKANYYIGGLYAFNYYGLSEQVPAMITIYNDKRSLRKKLGTLSIQLIKTPTYQIGDFINIKLKENRNAKIASLSRTILGAVMDWNRFGTLPIAFEWIKKHIDEKDFIRELIKATIKYGNISSKRRIGYFLDKEIQSPNSIKPLLKSIPITKNWVLLDPYGDSKGVTNKIWRIIDNVK